MNANPKPAPKPAQQPPQSSTAVAKVDRVLQMSVDELKRQPQMAVVEAFDRLRRQSVALLGDGEVFVRRDERGEVRAIRANMTLDIDHGEIVSIQGKVTITAPGYYALNQVAGVSVITPPTIEVPDLGRVVNPYIVQSVDGRTGRRTTSGVWVRKIAAGYSPTGNFVAIDSSLYLDLHAYFLQDVLNKVVARPECGEVVLEAAMTAEDHQKFLIVPYEYGLAVKVNFSHTDILNVLKTHVQRQKFVERIASTICERNAMKKHPCIAAVNVVPSDGVVSVPVYGWVHNLTENQIREKAMRAAEGTPDADTQVIREQKKFGDDDADTIDAQALDDEVREQDKAVRDAVPSDAAEPDAFEFPSDADTVTAMRDVLFKRFGKGPLTAALEEFGCHDLAMKDIATNAERRQILQKCGDQLLAMEKGTGR